MFFKKKNCKICNREGIQIIKLNFYDKKIIKFFNSEYNKNISKFLKKKIGKDYYILRKCNYCQFIWQENIPKSFFLKEIYDQIIDPNTSYKKSKKIIILKEKQFRNEIIFIQNFFMNKNLNVLDFGAGWGSWLLAIRKICPNIYAIELSNERKKFLKKKKIKIINHKTLNSYKNFFHVIRLEQVLEHLAYLDKVIIELKKILKKGGILSIGVPDGRKEINKGKINIKKGPIQPLEHLNCFNNRSLKTLFEKNGFRAMTLFEIILTYLKKKKFDYYNTKTVFIMIKNSILSTKINFIKI